MAIVGWQQTRHPQSWPRVASSAAPATDRGSSRQICSGQGDEKAVHMRQVFVVTPSTAVTDDQQTWLASFGKVLRLVASALCSTPFVCSRNGRTSHRR